LHVRVKHHEGQHNNDGEHQPENLLRNLHRFTFFARLGWFLHLANIDLDLAGANVDYSNWRAPIAAITRSLNRG